MGLAVGTFWCLPNGSLDSEAFVSTGKPAWVQNRQAHVARWAEEPRFSNDKLRAETEDPSGKVRLVLFGFLTALALFGFVVTLPKLAAAVSGVRGAQSQEEATTNLGIDLVASGVFGFLTLQELDWDSKREQAREEGALISRLRVKMSGAAEGEENYVPLSSLRASRGGRALRPILCIGDASFCKDCVSSAIYMGEAVDKSDFLIVPVLCSGSSDDDRSWLEAAAKDLNYVALPFEGSEDWDLMRRLQTAQVKRQGLDQAAGQVIIIKKNGRVGTRFLGVPNWAALAGEVNARVSLGMDTTTI